MENPNLSDQIESGRTSINLVTPLYISYTIFVGEIFFLLVLWKPLSGKKAILNPQLHISGGQLGKPLDFEMRFCFLFTQK